MISGLLRKSERDLIAEKLKEKGAPQPCHLCGHEKWILGEYIVSYLPMARSRSGLIGAPNDPVFPMVTLTCRNCGNANTVNLVVLGLAEEMLPEAQGN